MTEEAVRAIFFKHYSNDFSDPDSLNEALVASFEDVSMAILTEGNESGNVLPEIVRTVIRGKGRIGLFAAMFAAGNPNPVVPMNYILHFDHIRKAMLDAANYMLANYDTVQPWFRERFTREALEMISGDMSEAIEGSTGLPGNMRAIRLNELNLEQEFFVSTLVGILGVERFEQFANEYNQCIRVLRQCQTELRALRSMPATKES